MKTVERDIEVNTNPQGSGWVRVKFTPDDDETYSHLLREMVNLVEVIESDGDLRLGNETGPLSGKLRLTRDVGEQKQAGAVDDTDLDEDDEDEDKPKRRGSPREDEGTTVRRDRYGVLHVNRKQQDRSRPVGPGTRPYQILYLFAHYQYEHGVGDGIIARDISDAYDLDMNAITPHMALLRSAGLLEATDGSLHNIPYRVTDKGISYLKEHGKPQRYAIPEDGPEPSE